MTEQAISLTPHAIGTGLRAPMQAAFHDEELAGLKLSMQGRCASLAAIAVLLYFLNPLTAVLYYWLLLLGFAALGLGHYWVAAGPLARGWTGYLFVCLDFALLTFTVFHPNPWFDWPWPVQMLHRNDQAVYFFVLIVAVAFGYTPRLMLWAGFCAALGFATGFGWLAALPDTVRATPAAASVSAADLAVVLDPRFVDTDLALQNCVVMLIVAGLLAAVVARSRQLVVRQAGAARERANLARYFPPSMVDRLASAADPLGRVRAQAVAVLFADVVGFTRIAERESPDAVIALLRGLHARLERAVFDNHGTLDKFLGDGVMATFGTPEAGPRDAANAVACARSMLTAIDAWNAERRTAGAVPIRLSVGLHYGPVVLGDIGSERRLEFAVVGDVVNVASRLEELSRNLACRAVASADLVTAARGQATDAEILLDGFREAPAQALRGRDGTLALWTLG